MSQRSNGHHYRADSGRVVQRHGAHAAHPAPQDPAHPPRPTAKPPRHGSRKTDYTLGHSGRQVRIGPVTFWVAVGSLVIMAGWSLATGTYFAFHDDVLTRLEALDAPLRDLTRRQVIGGFEHAAQFVPSLNVQRRRQCEAPTRAQ